MSIRRATSTDPLDPLKRGPNLASRRPEDEGWNEMLGVAELVPPESGHSMREVWPTPPGVLRIAET